jgi:proline iminopeptidase
MTWIIRFLKYFMLTGLALAGIITLVAVGLYVATWGEYHVPETVLSDASLPRIEIDGLVLHAETFGEPGQPVVVVLHGGPGGDYGYLLNLHQLEDDYFVVFYDQLSAGLSPRVSGETLSLQSNIDDLHRLITHYSPTEPVRLIGHSWGAMLAAGYVGQHPSRVSHAVLAEPGALDNAGLTRFQQRQADNTSWAYYRVLIPTIFEALHLNGGPDAVAPMDYIYGKMSANFAHTAASGYRCDDESIQPVAPDVPVPPSRFGAIAYRTLFGPEADLSPITAHAETYTGAVLFLASACNTFTGAEFQREQMHYFPQAELVIIPKAGHEMFGENPTDSLIAVRNFFQQ